MELYQWNTLFSCNLEPGTWTGASEATNQSLSGSQEWHRFTHLQHYNITPPLPLCVWYPALVGMVVQTLANDFSISSSPVWVISKIWKHWNCGAFQIFLWIFYEFGPELDKIVVNFMFILHFNSTLRAAFSIISIIYWDDARFIMRDVDTESLHLQTFPPPLQIDTQSSI